MFLLLITGFAVISLANADFNLDVDDDGKTEALTDGLLVIRYLFGFSDDALVAGATSSNASRSSPAEIAAFLKNNESKLDIDNNGSVTALTDGLLVIRHLFGFSGGATAGVTPSIGCLTLQKASAVAASIGAVF